MKMLQTTREQMRVKKKLDAVWAHVRDNRQVYIVGASCLATGLMLRKPSVKVEANPTINVYVMTPEKEDGQ